MKKLITILFLLNLFSPIHSQFKRGLGFGTGTWGSGFHFSGEWQLDDDKYYGFEIRFIDIKNEEELPVYNPYTGNSFNVGDKALIMFPIYAKIRYLPFEGKIANNFSPFIELKLGPNFAIEGDGDARRFADRWKGDQSLTSYGGQIVMGAAFLQMSGAVISPSIGYEFLPFGQSIDGRRSYDGTTINVTFTFGNSRRK